MQVFVSKDTTCPVRKKHCLTVGESFLTTCIASSGRYWILAELSQNVKQSGLKLPLWGICLEKGVIYVIIELNMGVIWLWDGARALRALAGMGDWRLVN